jgi:8-oxo-dGTP pyrophosphatase MutT (NUDIX family)
MKKSIKPDRFLSKITVAAVIKNSENKFLMVEENTSDGIRINQPAGHLEENETLVDAVIREVKEETGLVFLPKFFISIHQLFLDSSSFFRFNFYGAVDINSKPFSHEKQILKISWLDESALKKKKKMLRSDCVLEAIDDFKLGLKMPLSTIKSLNV